MRFRKIPDLDYKQGAKEYARKLGPSDRHHLLTKPFYNLAHKHDRWEGEGLDADTHRHFCDFANMAVALALEPGAKVLDVGCGSGWLCEYFARFGYNVTGIDISSDLIDFARQRLNAVPFGGDHESPLTFEFLVHDIEAGPLATTFDAIICYDSLHHFEDEHEVLRNIHTMLNSEGQLFILEGEAPPEGSSTEDELRTVMAEYQTLESPFAREYLLRLLRESGFVVVGDYVTVNGLFDRDSFAQEGLTSFQPEAFNYLLCRKTVSPAKELRDSRDPGRLGARIKTVGSVQTQARAGGPIEFKIEVENTGDTIWLVSRQPARGTVRLGLKLLNNRDQVVLEVHGSPPLPHAVMPGERVTLKISQVAPNEAGTYKFKLDMVSQDVAWFEQHRSQTLEIPITVVSD